MIKPPVLRLWRMTPMVALVTAVVLVVAGILGAVFSEQEFRERRVDDAEAHARVLAASVSAALAFQDFAEAQTALDALAANPAVGAVAAYTADGQLFAGREGAEGPPPRTMSSVLPSRFSDNHASASAVVEQNGQLLGYVFVRLSSGDVGARGIRYIGLALLIVMSGIVVAVIAAAQRVLSSANAELSRRAEELAATNEQLSSEIAERRKAQSALAQAQKMEAIGQLTGGIAHDFNNLLMVVSSGLRLLETRDDEKKRASIVAAMRQAVDRGAGLTKQLLAFSRRQKLSPEVVLVQDRIEGLQSLLERSLREDIIIELDLDRDAPPVKIDPGQFDLAVLNLAVNARDAMPSGGRLTIRLRRTQLDTATNAIALSITDVGAGMPPDVLERAFDPFFTTKEVGKGTGLGLSQVYGFALQSGGRSEIESEPGQGTTVTLILPSTDEAAPPRPVERKDETVPGAGAVLVVEDDDAVAELVCEMISDLGYSPTRVANAREALAALEDGASIDVMFSDIIMPGGMSGIELAHEVRRRKPELPILLTTGYGGKAEGAHGAFKVLRKPYDRDELGAALSNLFAVEQAGTV
jgi:signal transduction histidine kinase/CheY-like chemotaxis protein